MAPLSLTGRILQAVVRLSCARPVLTVLTAVVLATLGVGYAAHALRLETSKFHLLPLHQPYATLYKDYVEDFGQLEDIVVVVQSSTVETSAAYAARLAGVLRDGAVGTARVTYQIDAARLQTHALLYVPLETLRDTLRTVASQEDLLADFAATPTLDRLVQGINQYIGSMFLPSVFGPSAPEERAGLTPTCSAISWSRRLGDRRSTVLVALGEGVRRPDPRLGRRLLPVKRPAAALRGDRPRRCAANLHRRARGDPRRPERDRGSTPAVPDGRGRRHRSARALQRRADRRHARRPDRQCPGADPHARALVARLPPARRPPARCWPCSP